MKLCAGAMICAAVLIAGARACPAHAISSTELISQSRDFDGKNVTYAGEVIGDVMRRGGHAWINISDGANAVGAWVPSALAARISQTGDFKHTGDSVEVVGIFNRSCVEHGGDLDIHAEELRIIAAGKPRMTCSLNKVKKDWVVKLLGVVAIVWILTLLKMR